MHSCIILRSFDSSAQLLKQALKELMLVKGVLDHAKLFKEDGNSNPCTVEFLKYSVVKAAFCIQESDKLVEISKGVMKSTKQFAWKSSGGVGDVMASTNKLAWESSGDAGDVMTSTMAWCVALCAGAGVGMVMEASVHTKLSGRLWKTGLCLPSQPCLHMTSPPLHYCNGPPIHSLEFLWCHTISL